MFTGDIKAFKIILSEVLKLLNYLNIKMRKLKQKEKKKSVPSCFFLSELYLHFFFFAHFNDLNRFISLTLLFILRNKAEVGVRKRNDIFWGFNLNRNKYFWTIFISSIITNDSCIEYIFHHYSDIVAFC